MTDDDYGIDSEPADLEVGRFALRTFAVKDGKLASIIHGAGHWENGACVAQCIATAIADEPHEAPSPGCRCGIYGTLSLAALFSQYREFACRIIAVIAAEGVTYIGSVGLRTAAARVVAYWCAEADNRQPTEADVCAEQCPGARRFYDVDVMARLYGLGGRR
jgi:hypothetical protein